MKTWIGSMFEHDVTYFSDNWFNVDGIYYERHNGRGLFFSIKEDLSFDDDDDRLWEFGCDAWHKAFDAPEIDEQCWLQFGQLVSEEDRPLVLMNMR